MSLKTRGKSTSINEVTNICKDGFWLLYLGKEYYVPFKDYPIFKKAAIDEIYSMTETAPGYLRWAKLDCDIEVEALENPEGYPLIYK